VGDDEASSVLGRLLAAAEEEAPLGSAPADWLRRHRAEVAKARVQGVPWRAVVRVMRDDGVLFVTRGGSPPDPERIVRQAWKRLLAEEGGGEERRARPAAVRRGAAPSLVVRAERKPRPVATPPAVDEDDDGAEAFPALRRIGDARKRQGRSED
jgi:hypothetical protein